MGRLVQYEGSGHEGSMEALLENVHLSQSLGEEAPLPVQCVMESVVLVAHNTCCFKSLLQSVIEPVFLSTLFNSKVSLVEMLLSQQTNADQDRLASFCTH